MFYNVCALQGSGAHVRVFTFIGGEFWEDKLATQGVPVLRLSLSSRLHRISGLLAALRRDPCDVIQSFHFYGNPYVMIAGRMLNLPAIGALRGNLGDELAATGRFSTWLAARWMKVVACNHRSGVEDLARVGVSKDRTYYLPNVVDTDSFSFVPRKRPASVILAASRLTQEKRLDRFLLAVAAVRKCNSAVSAWIAGDGPERAKLEKVAAQLGIASAVRFLGAVSEMAPVYHQADLLVHSSENEGTPNVIIEGMSTGLPVIAVGVDGVSDVVEHGSTGFTVPPDDSEALPSRITELLENSDLRSRMGGRARAKVVEDHSPDQLPGKIAGLYHLAGAISS
ncbi:MAG: glycosyltransferase family 4 protein [Bryobacteraceae bacterium]|nr:glycosyltransferase family 4 protein [Bryobacteraceae bacterium]